MNKKILLTLLCLLSVVRSFAIGAFDLRCEQLHQPWGIDNVRPALSWKLSGDHDGVHQVAYQILAATSPALLTEEKADLWNSGRVESTQSQWIPWGGKALSSRSLVYWQVKVWDEKGKASGWAQGAKFSVGILDKSLWKGKFIGMKRDDRKVQPLLWKSFDYTKQAGQVFLHLSTLGYHEIYLNGQPISDDVLAPSVVEFSKRQQAMSYNVTDFLRDGRNDLVIWLGAGWSDRVDQGGPYVMAQLDQQQGDGWNTIVATDDSWKARLSGYYNDGFSNPGSFGGEVVKASEMLPDFASATLDAAQWQPVITIPMPEREITPMMCEPNKIMSEIQPCQISRFEDDKWMVDMGKSIVGWTKIHFGHLRKGQRITISYCDMLGLNGDFEYGVFTDYYIASGEGDEEFCNKFNYHAYRYIKIQGLGHKPSIGDIAGMNIYTGYKNESSFVCNDVDINAVHDMIHYTFKCLTLGGYMVDCPHLERQGYGGDGNASILAAQLQYDMYPLYRNWLLAYGDAQGDDGEVPHVGPNPWQCGGGPFWCAFIANAPWQTYQQYGDLRLLERYYPNMQRYVAYAEQFMKEDGLLTIEHRWPSTPRRKNWFLGDWALPNEEHQTHPESVDDVNSCSMSWVYGIMAKTAALLGKTDDQRLYQQKQADINRRIHDTYYNKKNATYASGLQLDMAFPLFVGATPDALRDKVNEALKRETYDRFEGHFFTGLVGIPILTQWCTQAENTQMMYDMLKQHSFPGYLYMIENGATTTWEHWNAHRSRIHNCYNGVGSWFYQALAGIQADEAQPGYRHFTIHPQMADGINFVRAQKPTPYGPIIVEWKLSRQTFDLRVTVPVGATATVLCPTVLKPKWAERPPMRLARYGLMFNENDHNKREVEQFPQFDVKQPLQLESGTHRMVFHL